MPLPLWRFYGQVRKQDGGYALQLALITALILVIGTAAFLVRTSSGFVGSFTQSVNREARDVAESAIAEFAATMNRENNRHVLIAGSATSAAWAAATNPCTRFDEAGNETSATPLAVEGVNRFLPGGGEQNLQSGNNSRRFVIESVQYLDQNRATFAAAISANPDFLDDIRDGGNRTLLRVTVRGLVTRNGQTSTARVAREFEVVPKCCKRSFGSQGARNWGRDIGACIITQTPGGGRGILGALDGGPVTGSANQKDIRDENGDLVTQAICWDGNGGATPTILNGTPNPLCATGGLAIGNPANNNNTGISFAPDQFGLTLPLYGRSGVPWSSINLGNYSSRYIYMDTSSDPMSDPPIFPRVKMCELDGSSGLDDCERLDGRDLSTTSTPDPCYTVSIPDLSTSPPRPYYEVNCRLQSISIGNNTTVFIDTTSAKINLFFDNPSPPVNYINQGNGGLMRVDCRLSSGLSSAVSTAYDSSGGRCTRAIPWSLSAGDSRLSFQSVCVVGGVSCPNYDASELLNVYATGNGKFILNGTTSAVGMNFYAPKADIRLNGGGSANPNFMGRIWGDYLDMDGNIKIRTMSSLPSFCATNTCPQGTGGVPFFDFMARSFTHSSGF